MIAGRSKEGLKTSKTVNPIKWKYGNFSAKNSKLRGRAIFFHAILMVNL